MNESRKKAGFEVDPWTHYLGNLVDGYDRFWRRLGTWETRLLSDSLSGVSVDRPVYIAGLARSGSTKLLEALDWHPDVTTHRYRDFPMLYTPYIWNQFLNFVPRRGSELAERAHRDGILVGAESPEAFEEVLWMAFFPSLHDPSRRSVLDEGADNPEFESFYKDHIRKLLLVRHGARYVSKGNYNITRLEYLLRIFPDARFVIPVRDPVWHVASLMKQHALFCRAQQYNPRAVTHLRRVGHFEFGVDRRPINATGGDTVDRIQEMWEQGRDVEAWATYWNHMHAFIADRLEKNPRLKAATIIVRYDDLCREPGVVLRCILEHCELSTPPDLLNRADETFHFPNYYWPTFDDRDLETIRRCTKRTAERFGVLHRGPQMYGVGRSRAEIARVPCAGAGRPAAGAGRDA